MGEIHDVAKYDLDITAMEVKAQRVIALTAEIAKAQAAGGDTSVLEGQLKNEAAGFAKLTEGTERAGQGIKGLHGHTRELAAVVELAGGHFGGLVSQLSHLGSLLLGGGGIGAGIAVLVTGITEIVGETEKLNKELEKAAENLKKVKEGQARMVEGEKPTVTKIEDALQKAGGLSPGASKQAYSYMTQLQGMGFREDQVAELSALASLAGMPVHTAAQVAMAGQMPGGKMPTSVPELQETAARLAGRFTFKSQEEQEKHQKALRAAGLTADIDLRPRLDEALAGLKSSGMGRREVGLSALRAKMFEQEPARFEALFEPDRDALLVQVAKEFGLAPEKAGPEVAKKWREKLDALREELATRSLSLESPELRLPGEPGPAGGDADSVALLELANRKIKLLENLESGGRIIDEAIGPPPGAAPPGDAKGATTTNNFYDQKVINYIGTMNTSGQAGMTDPSRNTGLFTKIPTSGWMMAYP